MVTVTVLVLVHIALRWFVYDNAAHTPGRIMALSVVVAILTVAGGTIGGTLAYDYGFNVETAGDSPVWHASEVDVLPADKGRTARREAITKVTWPPTARCL